VVEETLKGLWYLSGGTKWSREKQREHLENILYGTCSIDYISDSAFAEELIETHPELGYFTQEGLPDIRLIVYRGKPVVSMLRIPTRHSQGKSNLHAGGFALDIDLFTGVTGRGWYCGRYIDNHPETGVILSGRRIPWWKEIITIGYRLPELFPLGYLGIDISIDASQGPLVLELNAQPGLEIQNVTKCGMRSLLENTL
jgi:alpha-L-glutamate ligase-like protein